MFDEETRKKLYESLRTEEGVKRYFGKNREKFERDVEDQKKHVSDIETANFSNEIDKKLAELVALGIQKTLEMFKDVLELLEISFLHRIETQNEIKDLITIIQEKGNNQESKLNELYSKLGKHEPSLEWIDKYFERSSKTIDE